MKDAAEANKGPCQFCGAVRDYVARADRQQRWSCGTVRCGGRFRGLTRSALCRARQRVGELTLENSRLREELAAAGQKVEA